ncbi:hypothetical protein CEP45_05820 [Mergibacter septicus]|uniref:MotA/TolQ/ExbB proton channel family protein n=1 Tax=Mergibacter septicus TaxID=221402 RepID=UPI001C775F1B|nr:MotA/TolQ/ExbB proton channel family protein [Mergibacter septicus]QDJ13398.1 hypothetical protein CEP45_05820 [Mergibacter septicus]
MNENTQQSQNTLSDIATQQVIPETNIAETAITPDPALASPPITGAENNTPPDVLDLLFGHGDLVLQGTFLLMLTMSIVSWTILLYRTFYAIQVRVQIKRHLAIFFNQQDLSFKERLALMNGKSPIKTLLTLAINSREELLNSSNKEDLNYADYLMSNIRHGLDNTINAQDGGLTVLASVGATAPFVGLFGTVWGIYHALINISVMGSVNIATISGPIGEALIATAFGLFVAIPAVLAYNALNRSNRVLGRKLDSFAHNLYRLFLHQIK